jgi:hypothetical protein
MRSVRQADPQARVVLIGYDAGAELASVLAKDAGQQGMPVDLVALVAGRNLTGELSPDQPPPPARRVINLHGDSWVGVPELPGSANYHLEEVSHYDLPAHPLSCEVLVRELSEIALQVPVVITDYGPVPPLVEPVPPPRPTVEVTPEEVPAEWNFLEARPIPTAAY